MDNFTIEDIDLFINSYSTHLLESSLLNAKIPVWVEYLKAKKHYRLNGMDEDYFFKKRFRIDVDDLVTIHKLIDRIHRGKSLGKENKSNIRGGGMADRVGGGSGFQHSLSQYSSFNEDEDLTSKENNFELLGQVQGAMDSYYKKMKKNAAKKNWKQNSNPRIWESNQIPDSVDDAPDRYYSEDLNSTRPNFEFDVQSFGRSELVNTGKSHIIQQIDKINNILDHNDLLSNDFDTNYGRSVPNVASRKKVQFTNHIEPSNGNSTSNYASSNMDVGAQRFWQDQSLLNTSQTRNSAIPNANPFEHQFDYLDSNYNKVMDPRLIGSSSRLDNRTTFNR